MKKILVGAGLATCLFSTEAKAEELPGLSLADRVNAELSVDYLHIRGPKVFSIMGQRQEEKRKTHGGRINFAADIEAFRKIFFSGEYYGEPGAQHMGKAGVGYLLLGEDVNDHCLSVVGGYAVKDYDFNVTKNLGSFDNIDKSIDGQGLYIGLRARKPSFRASLDLANYWGGHEVAVKLMGQELKLPGDSQLLQVRIGGEVRALRLGNYELRALAKFSHIIMDESYGGLLTGTNVETYFESEFGAMALKKFPGFLEGAFYLTGGINSLDNLSLGEAITEGKVSAGILIRSKKE